MSDVVHAAEPAPVPTLTALRQAREQAGLALPALAAMLKVPVQRLEALEEGRYHDLPDTTFARALASSVCRVLKIDPAPVLAALPATAAVRLGTAEGALNAPMPTRQAPLLGGGSAKVGPSRLPWANALAVLVVAVAATLWFLLPPRADTPVAEPAGVPAAADEPVAVPVSVPAPVVVADPAPPVPVPAPAPAPLPAQEAATTTATPPAAETTPVTAASSAVAPQAPAEGVLQLRARGASWVQVTGASGRVLLQRGLQAGELVAFSSDLPLTVVVGRADETEVQVRGAALDLAPLARNNVARFEVR